MIDAAGVIARRRADQHALLGLAHRMAARLPDELAPRAVVVFGSVARGDFNECSDVDVLVVAATPPAQPLARLDALGEIPPRVEAIVWTPQEWRVQLSRGNAIAVEARDRGVWIFGSPAALATAGDGG